MKNDSFFIKYRQNIIKIIIAFVAIFLVYTEGRAQLKAYDFHEVMKLLESLKTSNIVVLVILGLAAVTTMTTYDYFLIKNLKYNLSLFKVWKISWISNTFNNFLSFAGLTGASIRTLLYKKQGITTKEALYASIILAPSTGIGLSTASWLVIFNILKIRPVLEHYRFLWFGVIGFALYLPIYFLLYEWKWLQERFMARIHEYNKDPKELREKLMLSSLLEWTVIGIFFWFICTIFTNQIKILEALGIITVSAIAGIMSFIPGGMGSFDLICLLGLKLMGAPSERGMAILISFRLFYYIIPWLIGVVLGITEIIKRSPKNNIE